MAIRYYSTWKTDLHRCRWCGQEAVGDAFETGEIYAELIGKHCPGCGEEAFVIELPRPQEILDNRDKADPGDVLQAEIQLGLRKRPV